MKAYSLFLMLLISGSAHAQLTGTYKVVKSDCTIIDSFIREPRNRLNVDRLAQVKLADTKLQVLSEGYLGNFSTVFEYVLGQKRINCL